MVLRCFGSRVTQTSLAKILGTTRAHGTARHRLATPLRTFGLSPVVSRNGSFPTIVRSRRAGALVIVNFVEPRENEGHFAVVTGLDARNITLNDPWEGKGHRITRSEFLRFWNRRTRWMMTVK